MHIQKPKASKDWIIQKLQSLVWRLDNTGNGDFDVNGERVFISDIGKQYSSKPVVAFDIGANVGEYTEIILHKVTGDDIEIHLFEPQKTCFETISGKFSHLPNIHLNHFGLSSKAEATILYKDFDQSGLASVHKRNLDYYNMQMDEQEEIVLKRADEYLGAQNIKKINLIKISIREIYMYF
jgi:FkbM family methyltransferase